VQKLKQKAGVQVGRNCPLPEAVRQSCIRSRRHLLLYVTGFQHCLARLLHVLQ
jgi:hypothetical protein